MRYLKAIAQKCIPNIWKRKQSAYIKAMCQFPEFLYKHTLKPCVSLLSSCVQTDPISASSLLSKVTGK